MTLDSTTSRVQYTQSGTTTEWPVTFKFLDAEDLIVITTVADVDTTLELDTDYTVDGAGDDSGGTVTIDPAVAAGTKVTIYRVVDLDQPTELTTAGGWFPKVHETVFDRLTMQIQQVQEAVDRALRVGVTSAVDPETAVDAVMTARDEAQAAASAAENSAGVAQAAATTVGVISASGTLTTGQDTITTPWAYDHTTGAVAVYLDGVKQVKATLTFTDANTITLGDAVTDTTAWEAVSVVQSAGGSTINPVYIEQDATHRFVTDTEKTTWNGALYDKADVEGVLTGTITSHTHGSSVPAGIIAHFPAATAPDGWLKANGASLSTTAYAALFAAIGYTFGGSGGSFNVPDLRGEFLRGLDDSRGVDSGRTLSATAQGDQNKSHSHTGSAASSGAHTHSVITRADGSEGYPAGVGYTASGGIGTPVVANAAQSAGAHTHTLTVNTDGGTEARPRNIALLACIKY